MSLRLRLRKIVLEADTRAGRVYNLIIFGTILLSVAGLLVQPHPLRLAAPGEGHGWVSGTQPVEGCERLPGQEPYL